ncbi:hypothetical protein VB834_13860 [Limnoraphis robusta Tam1]|uniref:Uncharacterized protein n=1 Tax=Limnoraphis robusta CCNP1315 TaxID=3110306 RepID=A0ABU5U1D2_9CYAN|nr:hypothetical protein [Limnoraphis robusta]MEA5495702.1 hypothetical protein [Limnoraphis robusta BA-68 BA1]MEA5520996.1 hypothetical protein [Limnoraphis robusta CCNP1315]MEA5540117.1 hypothetical protein [Limnoraphis robusta Tam1]
MIIFYLCLSIAVVATVFLKLADPDEIHTILVILSGCVILGCGFLLAPLFMKLLISLTILVICQRIYETTIKL